MDLEQVVYQQDGGIVTIRMNRPEKLNAYGQVMKRELRVAWKQFLTDSSARVAILTGTGRAFCAGRDIKEQDQGLMGNWTVYEFQEEIPMPGHAPVCDKPIIAAVNGISAGAGTAMMSVADIRIASERATFIWPELATGILGPWSLAIRENLPWAVANYLALSGETVTAQRAHEIGLVAKVVPHEELESAARVVAEQLLKLPPLQLARTMNLLHRARPRVSDELEAASRAAYTETLESADAKEAARAFSEKRRPSWTAE